MQLFAVRRKGEADRESPLASIARLGLMYDSFCIAGVSRPIGVESDHMSMPHEIASPRISVVIPTYNRGSILSDTLRMVLRQDYDNYEIIVVDQSPKCSPEVEEVIAAVPE